MNRRRLITTAIVVCVLGILVYLQVREWRRFDWVKFKEGTEGVNYWRVLGAVMLVYLADLLRAVRWKIFLHPTAPDTRWSTLIAPQYIGFAATALLGRPGEVVRPYLIARRANLTLASQMAVWAVERIFDTGAVTVILMLDIFAVPSVRDIDYYEQFRKAGFALGGVFSFFLVLALAFGLFGKQIGRFLCEKLTPYAPVFATNLEKRLRSFSEGLHTVRGPVELATLSIISLGMWVLMALAYREVTHAYPLETGFRDLDLPQVILLMGATIVGGVMQLPVIGGGAQLASIAVLDKVFDMGPELSVSCGMLLWLVTFMSVIPLGLLLTRREHISIRMLEEEAEEAESSSPHRAPCEEDELADQRGS